ncbi:MAG: hypothetical protein F7C07_07745 [Desulfurococcales archaeon]|nr:hypothetical protein [Desulfurococcales archaeon]
MRRLKPVRAAFIGFGNVGRALVEEAVNTGWLAIASVSSSRGSVIVRGRKDLSELVGLASNGARLDSHSSFEQLDPVDAATESGASVAFVALPPSYETGEPNRSIYRRLASSSIDIVTADKTVLALEYGAFMSYAYSLGIRVGYNATVAAGTPVLSLARSLRGRGVRLVRGVLNATSNYLVSMVEKGLSWMEALDRARDEKLVEPDPRIDTHGWDAAAKLAIILSVLGEEASIRDVYREPLIGKVGEEEVRRAHSKGERLRYVAEADIAQGEYRVYPVILRENDPLARVEGARNCVVFEVEGDTIVVEGPAGPAWRTARVMIADALEIAAENTRS